MPTFDTLEYPKKLTGVGVPQEQAEVHVITVRDQIDQDLATKSDILRLEKAIEGVKAELTRYLAEVKADLRRDIKELEMRLTIRLGGLLVIGIGVIATID